jgi:hypothetical protein
MWRHIYVFLSSSSFLCTSSRGLLPEARGSRLSRKRRYSINQSAYHYIPDERTLIPNCVRTSNLKPHTRETHNYVYTCVCILCRSQWPGTRLLRLLVRTPPGQRMFVYCECCVLSGRGFCYELITRSEEFYRLWCVVCDLEISWMRRPWPRWAGAPEGKKSLCY